MHRILIAAASAALLAATAAPALADDYPPCRHPGEDHCRVVGRLRLDDGRHGGNHDRWDRHHHHDRADRHHRRHHRDH